jgi:hypothetical protein
MLMLADKQEDRSRRITVGADKTHDAKDFLVAARGSLALQPVVIIKHVVAKCPNRE